jgi:two-component system, cell cycle sensor histidine kinase and response regulator CckA
MTSPGVDQVPVLVVDDDPQLLRTLKDILAMRGYEPLTAGSGEAGLKIAADRQSEIAIALVDLRLPDMDGLDVVSKLHALSELTEVIVLTGHASLDSAVEALRHDSFDYLVKPVRPDKLLKTLRSATDRWQRRVIEQRLVETEERFRLVVENMSDLLVLADAEGTIRYTSPSVTRVLGAEAQQVVSTRLVDHVHPDDRPAFERLLADRRGRATRPLEHRFKGADGSWKSVESSLADLLDDPRVGSLVLVSRDVGERRKLESQLLHARKMESVGRLAGGIAHDFNNLLTVIMGATGVALSDLAPDSDAAQPLGDVLRAAQQAAELTRQLLAFSRQQILQPRLLDVNSLVSGMEKLLRRVLGESVELRTEMGADLWPVRADPTQLEQVIMNLIVNARDAMPAGGRITVRTSRAPAHLDPTNPHTPASDYVVVRVIDTGEGIRPEVQERIFEPFFTTKELGKGTGLGLATVHGIVEQSGGHLEVSSDLGRGSTFSIYLPRAAEPREPEKRIEQSATLPTGTETILLVEDESLLRELVVRCLTRQGYRVLGVPTAESALQLLAGPQQIDLLLTDVVLPGMSGITLAERAVELRPSSRVLFTTGYASAAPMGSWDRAELLQKPFTPEQIVRRVRAVLDNPPAAHPA